ncbi:MAG: putative quinol monooxygenase [Acidimicrobiales bacterium]|jgi:quinol monooxygenase YgiN
MAVIISGKIKLDPSKRDAFMAATTPLMDATRAEDGCLEYVFTRDTHDDGLVRLFEMWDSADNLGPHMKMPHINEFFTVIATLGAIYQTITMYEVTGETPLS